MVFPIFFDIKLVLFMNTFKGLRRSLLGFISSTDSSIVFTSMIYIQILVSGFHFVLDNYWFVFSFI